MTRFLDIGAPLLQRGSGTTLASTTFTAATFSNCHYNIYQINGFTGGTAATLQVLESGTVLFAVDMVTSQTFKYDFYAVPIVGTKGAPLSVTVDGEGTSIVNVLATRVTL